MPFLQFIDLSEASYGPQLWARLHALDVHRISKKRKISVAFTNDADAWTRQFLKAFVWDSITCLDVMAVGFELDCANLYAYPVVLLHNTFRVSNLLTLYDSFAYRTPANTDTLALQKAFSMPIVKLTVYATLTDEIMQVLPVSKTLKELILTAQGICKFTGARVLQHACPSLEVFALKSSNITICELNHFDWSRWPKLKALSFEYNYTLKELPILPKLEGLYISYTGIWRPPNVFGLTHGSFNVYVCKEWRLFFTKQCLQMAHITFCEYIDRNIRDQQFWETFKSLRQLSIYFKWMFENACLFNYIRNICPNVLVNQNSKVMDSLMM